MLLRHLRVFYTNTHCCSLYSDTCRLGRMPRRSRRIALTTSGTARHPLDQRPGLWATLFPPTPNIRSLSTDLSTRKSADLQHKCTMLCLIGRRCGQSDCSAERIHSTVAGCSFYISQPSNKLSINLVFPTQTAPAMTTSLPSIAPLTGSNVSLSKTSK